MPVTIVMVAVISIIAMMLVFIIAMMLIFVAPIIMIIAIVFVPVLMALFIARHIFTVVPAILHEIDALAAGIVFATVIAPVLDMTRRHAQVKRWAVRLAAFDDHGFGINYARLRIVADVDLAIKPRLSDTDRHAHIGCVCGYSSGAS